MDEKRLYLGCILGRAGTVVALREESGVYYAITAHLDNNNTYATFYDAYMVTEFQDDKAMTFPIAVNVDYDTALRAYIQGDCYNA
jgi:hypothetical protein